MYKDKSQNLLKNKPNKNKVYVNPSSKVLSILKKHELWVIKDKINGKKGNLKEFFSFNNTKFLGFKMEKINLNGLKFNNCLFDTCSLEKALFNETEFYNCKFINSNLNESKINNAIFQNCSFNNVKLNDLYFDECRKIENIVFENKSELSNCYFPNNLIKNIIFDDVDLSYIDFSEGIFENVKIINNSILEETNFIKSNFNNIEFDETINLSRATGVENYIFDELKKSKNIIKEIISEKNNLISKNEKLLNKSNDKLISEFKELKNEFFKEEEKWLTEFKIILKKYVIPTEMFILFFQIFLSIMNIGSIIMFLPIHILILTVVYFYAHQYNKAKNLRIENQNKISVVCGYEGIIIKEKNPEKISLFLQNISDVLFSKPRFLKDKGLPINEIFNIFKK